MREWLSFVFVDMVGSTDIEKAEKERGARCKELFRLTAERVFERFGAERCEWHGEGTPFFLRNTTSAIKASIDFIGEIRVRGIRDVEADISAKISISSGMAELKEEAGKTDEPFISVGGHLLEECPENSILITEDTYDALSDEAKDKFALFGTTEDREIAFIFPKEKAQKDKKDPAFSYRAYLERAKEFYKKLPSLIEGMRQSDLLDIFCSLKLKRRERKIGVRLDETQATPVMGRLELYSESPPADLSEVFQKAQHLFVLGDPGSGKTTLLKWLFLIHSQGTRAVIDNGLGDRRLLPIFLPISAICSQKKREVYLSPIDAICGYIKEFGGFSSSFLEERLERGECLILLDGLDEVSTSAERFEMADYISRFIFSYPKNRFVVTSRIIGFCEISGLDEVYTLSELDDEDIGALSEKWFVQLYGEVKKAEEERESLTRALKDSATKELAKSPFLLTVICHIHATGHRLPKYRARLYRQCCELLFERWPASKGKEPPMEYDDAERYLASLALWMQRETEGLVEREELKEKIEEIVKDRAEELFSWLTKTTQLLTEKGGNRWGFMHMSLQEFLTAVSLYKKDEYYACLKENSYNPKWREVFLLLCGYINIYGKEKELSSIIEELISRRDELEEILHKDLLLAGEIIAELGLKDKMAEGIIERIIDLAVRADYFELSNEVVKVLKKEKDISQKRLIKILEDKDSFSLVRMQAALALGNIGEKDTISLLTSILSDKKENTDVRRMAALALGNIGEKDTISLLTSILSDKKENSWVRRGAALALGNIGEKDAIPLLSSILSDKKEDTYVRGVAAWALGRIGGKDAISLLTSILSDKREDSWVRMQAASALGSIGGKDAISLLTSILSDKEEDIGVRRWAAWALGNINWAI